jgi:hypothetical protein
MRPPNGHEYAVVGRQPVEVHEVAAVLDALAARPADRGKLLRCERFGDDDEGERRHLLVAYAGNEVRVAISGEDHFVRRDRATRSRQPELAVQAAHIVDGRLLVELDAFSER